MTENDLQVTLEGKCCPSSTDWSVRYVIGRRKQDGSTQYVKTIIPIGPEVRNHLQVVGDDVDYRFGGVCMQGDCAHWTGGCSLGVAVAKVAIEQKMDARVPCAFKDYCRWYAENGSSACGGCAYVSRGISIVLDQRDPDRAPPFGVLDDDEDHYDFDDG